MEDLAGYIKELCRERSGVGGVWRGEGGEGEERKQRPRWRGAQAGLAYMVCWVLGWHNAICHCLIGVSRYYDHLSSLVLMIVCYCYSLLLFMLMFIAACCFCSCHSCWFHSRWQDDASDDDDDDDDGQDVGGEDNGTAFDEDDDDCLPIVIYNTYIIYPPTFGWRVGQCGGV